MKKFLKYFIIVLVLLICVGGVLYSYFAIISKPAEDHRIQLGISFSELYAEKLGLDWKEAYSAILDEMDTEYIRLSTYWDRIEKFEGRSRYRDVDFMMNEAAKRNKKVILTLGERQPRWPECHTPAWAKLITEERLREKEEQFIQGIVSRYKSHPALEMWQLENEPFLEFFGKCNFIIDKDTMKGYINLIREIDDDNLIMITASGELSTWFDEIHLADVFGTTMYRYVHNKYIGFWHYFFVPPSFYRVKAAIWGKPLEAVYIAELQAEPWAPSGDLLLTSLEVQEKSMNPELLRKNVEYAQNTGLYRAYLWGAEWWYWMKTVKDDSTIWETAQDIFNQYD